MNNTYRTDFENMRIPVLQNVHNGISHKKEELQAKMAGDMNRSSFYDILPRNYTILPMEKCSIHDIKLLDDLHTKQFNCFWTLEAKIAEANNDLENYEAKFTFYSFVDLLNDNELNSLYASCQEWNNGSIMTSHDIIEQLKKNPNFLEEAYAL